MHFSCTKIVCLLPSSTICKHVVSLRITLWFQMLLPCTSCVHQSFHHCNLVVSRHHCSHSVNTCHWVTCNLITFPHFTCGQHVTVPTTNCKLVFEGLPRGKVQTWSHPISLPAHRVLSTKRRRVGRSSLDGWRSTRWRFPKQSLAANCPFTACHTNCHTVPRLAQRRCWVPLIRQGVVSRSTKQGHERGPTSCHYAGKQR